MPYTKWFNKTIKKVKKISELRLYFHVLLFGLGFFGLAFTYTTWQEIPNVLNKSVADTSIFLIGMSMLLTSLCYFWDFVDTKIIYRKHLGLIGFAFGLVHIGLSWDVFKRLITIETWQQGVPWAAFTAAIATVIFTIMALISNNYSTRKLGGQRWRQTLRLGYVAIIFVWLHVALLKSKYWIRWWQEGPDSPPSMSLLVALFMLIVVVMRIALQVSILRKRAVAKK